MEISVGTLSRRGSAARMHFSRYYGSQLAWRRPGARWLSQAGDRGMGRVITTGIAPRFREARGELLEWHKARGLVPVVLLGYARRRSSRDKGLDRFAVMILKGVLRHGVTSCWLLADSAICRWRLTQSFLSRALGLTGGFSRAFVSKHKPQQAGA